MRIDVKGFELSTWVTLATAVLDAACEPSFDIAGAAGILLAPDDRLLV
jgi:hypothetical protein